MTTKTELITIVNTRAPAGDDVHVVEVPQGNRMQMRESLQSCYRLRAHESADGPAISRWSQDHIDVMCMFG